MKIIDVGLMLETRDRTDVPVASRFGFENRFIGNYLRRMAQKTPQITEGFNRIVLIALEDNIKPPVVEDKFLKVYVSFDRKSYEKKNKEELPEFFCEIYLSGLDKAKHIKSFSHSFFTQAIERFKKNGYRNEWQAKSKRFKEIDVIATLKCSMTIDHFSLLLEIRRGENILFNEEIFQTLPDETFFSGEFEDIIYDNRQLSVINNLNGRIFNLDWPFLK